jgi:5-methylcytosine-specific restriction endonuclease McrA
MAQRTCTIDGCERKHSARGLCAMHWKQAYGRRTTYSRTCLTCDENFRSARADGKFCSDLCKGQWYSDTMRRKCALPAHHPVMVLIAESRASRPSHRLKAELAALRLSRECPACGSWFCPLQPKAALAMLYCSDRCGRRMARRRRRARENGAVGGSWRWSDFMRIARKFNYCCACCGIKPTQLDPDHVLPLSRGGYDSPTNLLPACVACNSSKGARTLSEWEEWRATRDLPPLQTNWASGDPRYVHLTQVGISRAA